MRYGFCHNFRKYSYIIMLIGFFYIITIELTSIDIPTNLYKQSYAQPLSAIVLVNKNLEQQDNESKIINAFGHFANNQIKDGIVTWIQGGYWNLTINNKTIYNNDNFINSNILINNDNRSNAEFISNFTMIKPDGSLSHTHTIKNFIPSNIIITDRDIVVMGTADIYSDNNNKEYKNVPLTIHLMGNKVLGLTIDVSKTEGHFSSSNEMFGTLISGVGLNSSSIENFNNSMNHHNNTMNNIKQKELMARMNH